MTGTVVFDVNILVSAILAPGGTPARELQVAIDHGWDIRRSVHIVQRLIEVAGRPRFYDRLPNAQLNAFLGTFQGYASVVEPDPSVIGVCDDEEDDLVLGTAVRATADYLVTRYKGMLRIGAYRGVRIVSAAAFLDIFQGAADDER